MAGSPRYVVSLTSGSLNAQRLHLLNGGLHANKHRAGNDAVPNVQFLHAVDRGDREHIAVGQSMAGMEMQPRCFGEFAGRFENLKLFKAKRCLLYTSPSPRDRG